MRWRIEYTSMVNMVEARAQTITARRSDLTADGETGIPWTCSAAGRDKAAARLNIEAEIERMEETTIPNWSPRAAAAVSSISDETIGTD